MKNKEERIWSNKGLLEEKQDILRWMDANDAHMSLPANERLRIINQQLIEINERPHKWTKSDRK